MLKEAKLKYEEIKAKGISYLVCQVLKSVWNIRTIYREYKSKVLG